MGAITLAYLFLNLVLCYAIAQATDEAIEKTADKAAIINLVLLPGYVTGMVIREQREQ